MAVENLDKMTANCLQLQPRADEKTAASHTNEIGSYVYNNMHLLEILDYCQRFERVTRRV